MSLYTIFAFALICKAVSKDEWRLRELAEFATGCGFWFVGRYLP